MGLEVPPLRVKIALESKPPKPKVVLRRLAVPSYMITVLYVYIYIYIYIYVHTVSIIIAIII